VRAQAYDLYLKGKHFFYVETHDSTIEALEWFDRALELDPDFALAWAGRADALARLAFTFEPEGDAFHQAQKACERALSLDPTLPEARYVRVRLNWSPQGGFDHGAAIRDLVPILRERPSLEEAHLRLGVVLFHVGMTEEAIIHVDRALVLRPQYGNAIDMRALCLYQLAQVEAALELIEVSRRLGASPWNGYQKALGQLRLGRLTEAKDTARHMEREWPHGVLVHPVRGLIAALEGDVAEADRQVQLIVTKRKSYGHYHHAVYDMACIHSLLGRNDRGLTALIEAAHDGYPCHPFFEQDPFLERLRGTERFAKLMAELKTETAGYARLLAELEGAG
jgi:serine/threonine-protein kinase